MNKRILIVVIAALVLAIPVVAAVKYATLINSNGDKVVVAANSWDAQKYFGQGYVLMGAGAKPALPTCQCPSVGAMSGPDIYNDVNIHGTLRTGGLYTDATTTMNTNFTLTADQVCKSSVITVNSAAAAASTMAEAALTVTLPATTTLFSNCLTEEGSTISFWFANLSPTAASTTVITAGDGIDLLECDDGSDCNVVIGGGDRAKIELVRMPSAFETNLSVLAAVTEYSAAD